jgi:hypothetical protein
VGGADVSDPDADRRLEHLEKVNRQLSRYEHPLFQWEARSLATGVEVAVSLKIKGVFDEPYQLVFKPREIDARGFEWDFQRQLFNCLHDYLVEMFIRSPHITEI